MSPATLLTLALMAAAVGWTLALALPGPPAYLAGLMAAEVFVVELFRRLDRRRGRLMAVGEGVAVILVPVAGVALYVAADAAALFVGFIAALISWLLTQITVSDLDAVADPADALEGVSTAPERLRGRFLWVGAAQAVAVVAGYGGLAPPLEPRPATGEFVVSYGVYWLVGVAALSSVERRRRLARWRREGTIVDADLESRWTRGRAILLLGVGLLSIAGIILGRGLLAAGHLATTWLSARVASMIAWLTGDTEREIPPNQVLPSAEEFQPPVTQPIEVTAPQGDWIDLVLLVVFGLVFLGVYLLFLRRRGAVEVVRSASVWSTAWKILRELASWLAGLPIVLVGWWRRRQKSPRGEPSKRFGQKRSQPWRPTDPFRRRIGAEFRSYLNTAEGREVALMPSETPSEFGARGSDAVRSLTDLYAVARYSEHVLGQSDVEAAGAARRQAVADLETDAT